MASLLKFPTSPRCLNCLRKTLLNDNIASTPAFSDPLRTQWRGKKKLPKRTTVNVRLLKDVAGYGRKGYIVPVAPGRMRNMWYPQGRAEYVTPAEQKAQQSMIVERDHSFNILGRDVRMDRAAMEAAATSASATTGEGSGVSLLSPSRSIDLLTTLVPPVLDFRRQPIQTPAVTEAGAAQPDMPSPSPSSSSPVATSGAAAIPTTAIYGSVTTGDVSTAVLAALALAAARDPGANADALRVVLAPEDVGFVIGGAVGSSDSSSVTAWSEERADRVKSLGEWTVAINVKGAGAGDAVMKTIRVLPEVTPVPESNVQA